MNADVHRPDDTVTAVGADQSRPVDQLSSPPGSRLITAAAMITAPVLLLGSTVVALLDHAYNRSIGQGALEMFALGIFVLAVLGATQLLGRAHPRSAGVLLITGTLGCQAGVAFGVVAMARAKGVEVPEGPLALTFNLPALLFPLSWVVIGILLLRSRLAAVWVGPTLVLAGLAFPVARAAGVAAVAVIDDTLFVIGLAGLAAALIRPPRASTATDRSAAR